MSKNFEWTGKPFEWMKILLIRTIGCTICLPIIQMIKLLKRHSKHIMEQAMLLCIVFISFFVVVNFKAFILKIEN